MERDLTLEDLKGKQSVRATFRLPQQVIDLLALIAGQLGIKQKSLFDQLVEDADVLDRIAKEVDESFEESVAHKQKTFVLSRSSLSVLNSVAAKRNISRDLLVEISIRRLLPVMESEIEKHVHRKALLKEMKMYLKKGEALLEKTEELLGKDDLLYGLMENQVAMVQKNFSTIDQVVKKGMPMEEW
jgi:hypothetical protein